MLTEVLNESNWFGSLGAMPGAKLWIVKFTESKRCSTLRQPSKKRLREICAHKQRARQKQCGSRGQIAAVILADIWKNLVQRILRMLQPLFIKRMLNTLPEETSPAEKQHLKARSPRPPMAQTNLLVPGNPSPAPRYKFKTSSNLFRKILWH